MIRARVPYAICCAILFIIVHAAATATEQGAKLYASHCATCHGNNGSGSIGLPLNLPDLHAIVDDNYLAKTIQLGRPGRIMPAFTQLSAEDVAALVKHLRSLSKPVKPVEVKLPRGDALRGKPLYEKHCAHCHGDNAEGGPGTGVTFSRPREWPIMASALNNPGFLGAASDIVIKRFIIRGIKGTPMPSSKQLHIQERDVDDIVAYLRRLENQQPVIAPVVDDIEPLLLIRESRYNVQETATRIQDAMSRFNLRLIRTANYPPTTGGTADTSSGKQLYIDGCDFGLLNQALGIDPRVGVFLPCRINITQTTDKVLVMTINPKGMSPIFNNNQLSPICKDMFKVYNDLLDEAIE